jgi:hypothetical protein
MRLKESKDSVGQAEMNLSLSHMSWLGDSTGHGAKHAFGDNRNSVALKYRQKLVWVSQLGIQGSWESTPFAQSSLNARGRFVETIRVLRVHPCFNH